MSAPVVAWGSDAYMVDRNGPVISQFMDFALAQVVSEYASQGVALPDRKYWTIGQEALDCEQVALAVQTTTLGTTSFPAELSKCSGPRMLAFTLQIVRCAPVGAGRGRAPAASSIQNAAIPGVRDMEIMIYALPARFDVYQQGIIASVNAASAEGGLQGAVGSYTVNL
jgi:hypothetical protein